MIERRSTRLKGKKRNYQQLENGDPNEAGDENENEEEEDEDDYDEEEHAEDVDYVDPNADNKNLVNSEVKAPPRKKIKREKAKPPKKNENVQQNVQNIQIKSENRQNLQQSSSSSSVKKESPKKNVISSLKIEKTGRLESQMLSGPVLSAATSSEQQKQPKTDLKTEKQEEEEVLLSNDPNLFLSSTKEAKTNSNVVDLEHVNNFIVIESQDPSQQHDFPFSSASDLNLHQNEPFTIDLDSNSQAPPATSEKHDDFVNSLIQSCCNAQNNQNIEQTSQEIQAINVIDVENNSQQVLVLGDENSQHKASNSQVGVIDLDPTRNFDDSGDDVYEQTDSDDEDEDTNITEAVISEIKKEIEVREQNLTDDERMLGVYGPRGKAVWLDDKLAALLKKHQLEGVRFCWERIVETPKNHDRGCILAHSMGLGKTLQMVTFIHMFLKEGCGKRILIVCPKSTLLNWRDEFVKWTRICDLPKIRAFYFPDGKTPKQRKDILRNWDHNPRSVFIISFEMYARSVLEEYRHSSGEQSAYMNEAIKMFSEPGPDLLIIDEGQNIKNKNTKRAMALSLVQTRNRVILTGTPLQNHLMEFFCMIDFVRPGFWPEQYFSNYFKTPIEMGMTKDATPLLVTRMKKRAFALVENVKTIMDRRDQRFLAEQLPPKYEFLVFLKLSDFQKQVYSQFIQFYESMMEGKIDNILYFVVMLQKIINHPDLLIKYIERQDPTGEIRQNSMKVARRKKLAFVDLDPDDEFEEKQRELELFQQIGTNLTVRDEKKKKEYKPGDSQEWSIDEYLSFDINNIKSTIPEKKKIPKKKSSSPYNSVFTFLDENDSSASSSAANTPATSPSTKFTSSFGPQTSSEIPKSEKKPTPARKPPRKKKKKSISPKKSEKDTEQTLEDENEEDLDEEQLYDVSGEARYLSPEEKEAARRQRVQNLFLSFSSALKWAENVVNTEYKPKMPDFSSKIQFLTELIEKCCFDSQDSEKLLVFSQFVETLDVIQECLEVHKFKTSDGKTAMFDSRKHFLRIEGCMSSKDRHKSIKLFNNMNHPSRVMLVSTKAGGLGINLTAATRVVLFDITWDPTWIKQAIFRAYRYGQKRSVYVYHLIGSHTVEESIYKRCLKKNWMFAKVIDEMAPARKLTAADMNIHEFDHELDPLISQIFDAQNKEKNRIPILEKDFKFLNKILKQYQQKKRDSLLNYDAIVDIEEHDTLYIDELCERITEPEKRQAIREYNSDKDRTVEISLEHEIFNVLFPEQAQTVSGQEPAIFHANPEAVENPLPESVDDMLNTLSHSDLLANSLRSLGRELRSDWFREFLKGVLLRQEHRNVEVPAATPAIPQPPNLPPIPEISQSSIPEIQPNLNENLSEFRRLSQENAKLEPKNENLDEFRRLSQEIDGIMKQNDKNFEEIGRLEANNDVEMINANPSIANPTVIANPIPPPTIAEQKPKVVPVIANSIIPTTIIEQKPKATPPISNSIIPPTIVDQKPKAALPIANPIPEITNPIPKITNPVPQTAIVDQKPKTVPPILNPIPKTTIVEQKPKATPQIANPIPQIANIIPKITNPVIPPTIVEQKPKTVPPIANPVPKITNPVLPTTITEQKPKTAPAILNPAPQMEQKPKITKKEAAIPQQNPIPPTTTTQAVDKKPKVKNETIVSQPIANPIPLFPNPIPQISSPLNFAFPPVNPNFNFSPEQIAAMNQVMSQMMSQMLLNNPNLIAPLLSQPNHPTTITTTTNPIPTSTNTNPIPISTTTNTNPIQTSTTTTNPIQTSTTTPAKKKSTTKKAKKK